jgi:hypothetical protein
MLKELFESLSNQSVKAKGARVVEPRIDPRKLMLDQDGAILEFPIPPPLRCHSLHSLQSLIDAALSDAALKPVVYHSPERVVLIYDDADRRDTAIFTLVPSPPLKTLRDFEGREGFSARELWFLFKTTFDGCGISPELIRNLQKLRWRTGQETRTDFSQGRESIGRDVESEIHADLDFPETIVLDLFLYENPGENHRWSVRCFLIVEAVEQRIRFGALPGELKKVEQLHQEWIANRLSEGLGQVPIYFGAP